MLHETIKRYIQYNNQQPLPPMPPSYVGLFHYLCVSELHQLLSPPEIIAKLVV